MSFGEGVLLGSVLQYVVVFQSYLMLVLCPIFPHHCVCPNWFHLRLIPWVFKPYPFPPLSDCLSGLCANSPICHICLLSLTCFCISLSWISPVLCLPCLPDGFWLLLPLKELGLQILHCFSFGFHLGPFTLHLGPLTLHLGPFALHLGPFALHLGPFAHAITVSA